MIYYKEIVTLLQLNTLGSSSLDNVQTVERFSLKHFVKSTIT